MAKTEAGMSRSRSRRLMVAIGISAVFFLTEISGWFSRLANWCRGVFAESTTVGFYTHSLALVADAFHYVSVGWTDVGQCGMDYRR
jgi:zinc transporter 1